MDITETLGKLTMEERQIGEKIIKLNQDLSTDGLPKKIGDYHYALLLLQHSTMIAYRQVLIIRIQNLQSKI